MTSSGDLMQTRRLRLGDVVDDYCPRERRLSNHVVVAMVEDAIKQTRCSTCDFEHPYKDAKVPPRRKKKDDDAPAVLYQQVLDSVLERHQAPAHAAASASVPVPAEEAVAVTHEPPDLALPPPAPPAAAPVAPAVPAVRGVLRPVAASSPPAADQGSAALAASASDASSSSSAPESPVSEPDLDEASGYRRNLIRATLPRPVGEVPVRAIPTFTIREAAAARPGKFRHKGGPRQGRPNGMTGPMSMGGRDQGRPGAGRNQQGRPTGGGKKTHAGGPQGGNTSHGAHGAKGRQGGPGNKRFK